jgi:hypothetical protein
MIEHPDWKAMAERRALVMQTQHGRVGRIVDYFDGIERVLPSFIGSAVRLDNGHEFIANPSNFVELSARELEFYVKASESVQMVVTELARYAKIQGIEQAAFAQISISLLADQTGQLRRLLQQLAREALARAQSDDATKS